jgi:hypothetical protein
MSNLVEFWNIRFSANARNLFSQIPRGEAARFDEAIQRLRKGPNPPGVQDVGEGTFVYTHNGYRIAFEVLPDVPNTIRVTRFEQEPPAE